MDFRGFRLIMDMEGGFFAETRGLEEDFDDLEGLIDWTPDMDHEDFIRKISRGVKFRLGRDEPPELDVNQVFVEKFLDLDATSANQVTEALLNARIVDVRLWGMAQPVFNPSLSTKADRWNQICSMLRSMASLTTAYCFLELGEDELEARSIHCGLVPHLPQVSKIYICAREEVDPVRAHDIAHLVANLELNQNLKELELRFRPGFLTAVLPAIKCGPMVETVYVTCPNSHQDVIESVEQPDAQAMAQFLTQDLPFAVVLDSFDFTDDESCYPIICDGIAACRAKGFKLVDCDMGDDLALLERAIAQSVCDVQQIDTYVD